MKRLTLGICMMVLSPWLWANPNPGSTNDNVDAAIRQQERLQRLEQDRIRFDEDEARKKFEDRREELRKEQQGFDLKAKNKTKKMGVGSCRDIKTIHIVEAPVMWMISKEEIKSRYVGRCLNSKDIEDLMSEVSQYYLDRGYVTTRAFLQAQDISKGEVTIKVVEGRIEKIIIDDGNKGSIKAHLVFPNMEGAVLNLRDIEQGMDQINRLSSNAALMDIRPGKDVGSSVVYIKNTTRSPFHFTLASDNTGAKSTGQIQTALTTTSDNILNLQESISYTHRESTPNNVLSKYASSDSISLNIPWGYFNFSLNSSYSENVSMVPLPSGTPLKSNGNNLVHSARTEVVVWRSQQNRLAFYSAISVKDNKSYLADQFLSVGSKKLAGLEVGATFSTTLLGGPLGFDVGYSKGLDWFGALKDPPMVFSTAARYGYSKATLGINYSYPIKIRDKQLDWNSSLSTQWGFVPLFGSEQMSIGGLGSVRGFVLNSLSGENGFYWRNDLAHRTSWKLGERAFQMKFYTGYDFGRVTSLVPGNPEGQLDGMVLGLSIAHKGANLDISQTRPLRLAENMVPEDPQTWVRFSYSF